MRKPILLSVMCLSVLGTVEAGRRLVLSHSLYELNLRSSVALRPVSPPEPGQRILVFAPHPDDETLGAGGLIQQAVRAGARVRVVVVTNGELPESSAVIFEETLRPQPPAYIQLGYRRQRETLAAMQLLGLTPRDVTFLGYPNGYLNLMWLPSHWAPNHPVRSRRTLRTSSPYTNSFTPNAPFCGQSLLADVHRILRQTRPDVIICLHPNDVHPDHWPTYTFVRLALEELAAAGEAFVRHVSLQCYLVHRNHWPAPRRFRPWLRLEPPLSLTLTDETQWCALPVTVAEAIAKHRAITGYRTQAGPISTFLSSFARANELFGVIPARQWPAGTHVPLSPILHDPVADIDSAARNPRADIQLLELGRDGQRLIARLTTRGPSSRKLGYHLSVHCGGATEADRRLAEYHWQGSSARGFAYRGGALRRIDPASLEITFSGNSTMLSAPWPGDDDSTAFLMVRAWTTRGRLITDQTSIPVLRIVSPQSARKEVAATQSRPAGADS